jgi:hypothetical protein
MTCQNIKLPNGAQAIVCTRGKRGRKKLCQFCKYYVATKQCDFPLDAVKANGEIKTCDAFICEYCAVHLEATEIDYCPPHALKAKVAKPLSPNHELLDTIEKGSDWSLTRLQAAQIAREIENKYELRKKK